MRGLRVLSLIFDKSFPCTLSFVKLCILGCVNAGTGMYRCRSRSPASRLRVGKGQRGGSAAHCARSMMLAPRMPKCVSTNVKIVSLRWVCCVVGLWCHVCSSVLLTRAQRSITKYQDWSNQAHASAGTPGSSANSWGRIVSMLKGSRVAEGGADGQ